MASESRTFCEIFAMLDDGMSHDDATRHLRDVVRAARSSQKKAALTIKLSIEPDGRQFIIKADIKPTIPTMAPGVSMFYATEEGELSKSDPAQLPLRHVERPAQPIRTIGIDANKGA